jgi:hypothetical protein
MQQISLTYSCPCKTNSAILFFVILFFVSPILKAQIIMPQSAAIVVSEPAFNNAFIKINKIKTITASVADKPDGEIIRDKGLAQVYLFDTAGTLIHHYFNEITALEKTEIEIPAVYNTRGRVIKKSFTKTDFQYQYDTLGTEYAYTSTGYVIMKRTCTGDFYNTTYYEYFGDGFVSRQVVCKETNIAKPNDPFKLGVQTILSEENFQYENLTPSQLKKTFLNTEGKAYKQGIINTKDGKVVDESYQFLTGFIRSAIYYRYDHNGRLTEKISTDNSSGTNSEKILYEYASDGNLNAEKRFKNGSSTEEIIYLYDDLKKFLISQASRNLTKASVKIIKYEYAFY